MNFLFQKSFKKQPLFDKKRQKQTKVLAVFNHFPNLVAIHSVASTKNTPLTHSATTTTTSDWLPAAANVSGSTCWLLSTITSPWRLMVVSSGNFQGQVTFRDPTRKPISVATVIW